ncbi:MAG TPA: TonB family protein [Parafilimonas sp.]|jgi:protein TonB
MLPDKILQSDLLDILFENRNKDYGAYALRRSFNKTMISSITATLFIAMAFCIFQLIHHAKNRDIITSVIIQPDQILSKFEEVKPITEKPAPQHAATHFNQVVTSTPVITKDNQPTQMPTINDIDKSNIGDVNLKGDDATNIVQPVANSQTGSETITTPAVEIKPDDKPLNWAQIMPEYPGGIEALRKFMLRNLKQPDDLQAGEKIVVMASFVVNKNGQIEQVKIINSGRADLDKEVQRVINKMPFWKPGLQNGNAVSVYFNLPVTFMSEEEN